MIDMTQAFFERLAERGYEPLLHSTSGTVRWDIENAGSWYVVSNNGSLSVGRHAVRADCVFACSREDFDRMVVGKQNPTTLFMQGKPQAWATGAPLLLLRAILGLEPVGDHLVVDPALPSKLGRLELLDIPGSWGRIDAFGRGRVDTSVAGDRLQPAKEKVVAS